MTYSFFNSGKATPPRNSDSCTGAEMELRRGKRPAAAFDARIGLRIREQRKLKGMTQQQLADALQISFQQVQKYEHGTNKISVERLFQLSTVFGLPLEAWVNEGETSIVAAPSTDKNSRQALLLLQAFHAIPDEEGRALVCNLARTLAGVRNEQSSGEVHG